MGFWKDQTSKGKSINIVVAELETKFIILIVDIVRLLSNKETRRTLIMYSIFILIMLFVLYTFIFGIILVIIMRTI